MPNAGAKPSASANKVSGAASAAKLLGVILCFSAQRPRWTVAELCEGLKVSLATMYRYVAVLRKVGLIEDSGSGGYRLSKRFIELAGAAQQGQSTLDQISLPVITAIRDKMNETVLIVRRHQDYAYCVERVKSTQAVRLQFTRGQPMKLHRGAAPRVLLAFAPPQERDRYLASIASQIDRKTAKMLSARMLAEVMKNGYTESFGEIDEGIWGVAAAVREDGQVIAALAIAAPIFRINGRKRQRMIAEVRRGANEISRLLSEDTRQRTQPSGRTNFDPPRAKRPRSGPARRRHRQGEKNAPAILASRRSRTTHRATHEGAEK